MASKVSTFVDSAVKHSLPLVNKTRVSPDSFIFRFKLPSDDHVPGLKPHEHVKLHARIDGEKVERKMTPITDDDVKGYMDLLIKIYYKVPEYPNGGIMTQFVDSLKIGDHLTLSGPVAKINYEGNGKFKGRKVKHLLPGKRFKNIVMIAGGSGITPMYQIIQHSLKHDPEDISLYLLFANRTPKDVLLKEQLDKWAAENPRLHVWYTVNNADGVKDWPYSTGYITKEMLAAHLPPPSDDTIILIIGPRPMKVDACFPNLEALGYDKDLTI